MKPSPFHGFLIVDKPGGITSRDAVDRAQRWFPRGTKLGHTGTLDPLATGVLVLAVGCGTRLTEYVQDMAKTYRAGVVLGARSDTDDADGTITPVAGARAPDRATLEQALAGFVGEIEQVPPCYSAAKVAGRRAYDLARRGQDVSLEARRVRVYGIDLLSYEYPRLALEVRCGKGTYIRSLARDLGERLGSGGYIETLRRTRVGDFDVADGIGPDVDAATARCRLLPLLAGVANLPQLTLDARAVRRLGEGGAIHFNEPELRGLKLVEDREVAVLDTDKKLALIAAVDSRKRVVRPAKVLRE